MLSYVSCVHSLKKSQINTKRVGNKRKVYNYKKSYVMLLHSLLKFKKKIQTSESLNEKYTTLGSNKNFVTLIIFVDRDKIISNVHKTTNEVSYFHFLLLFFLYVSQAKHTNGQIVVVTKVE